MRYPINEIFQTLQGEGYFTGVPAIFIRFHGCPVGCSWCDTQYTWETRAELEVDMQQVVAKSAQSASFGYATEQDLLSILQHQGYSARHVVITGGEPCMYSLLPLTLLLEQQGFTCQIETSGTHEIYCSPDTWVTVSPKIQMRGGFEIVVQALQRADEIKHPVGRMKDIEVLDELLAGLNDKKRRIIGLQPVSQQEKATELCINACISRNWRLSVQMHKYLDIA